MAKTLEELQAILTAQGYECRKISDICLRTKIATKAYTNAEGHKSIAVLLAFDHANECLTIDTPWAFDSKQAAHKEAMLACLLSASAKSPLVKTQLDPADGEVRLRVDCCCGSEGVPSDNVLKMLSLIPEFADRWYPHIRNAMEKGTFDPAGRKLSDAEERLAAIAQRAGGINRLKTLLWLRDRNN